MHNTWMFFKVRVTTHTFKEALLVSMLRGEHICARQSLAHAVCLKEINSLPQNALFGSDHLISFLSLKLFKLI